MVKLVASVGSAICFGFAAALVTGNFAVAAFIFSGTLFTLTSLQD